ncbi:hypothetical protein [Staphylococcus sp. LKG3-3]|uniref:hypothetical protein n=1 Tax=Staphylococcus sp. LKG3-3 TaxID=3399685 RepID=UPI003D3EA04E
MAEQRKRRPLTLHEKWKIDGEIIAKDDLKNDDSDRRKKNVKANIERINRKYAEKHNNK